MFVQIAEGLGIRSILHTNYKSTCAKLLHSDCRNDKISDPLITVLGRRTYDNEESLPCSKLQLQKGKMKMETKVLSQDLLHKMDAYWRAANYLSVGQL